MPYIQEGPGCISFTLAGVPTLIRPSVWLVLLVLGSAGSANFSIVPPLVFMVMGVLCLLVHEYGHAFSCRALGGGESIVELGSLGGVTYSSYPPPTRATHIIMVLAGPGASLLLGLLGGFTLGNRLLHSDATVVPDSHRITHMDRSPATGAQRF